MISQELREVMERIERLEPEWGEGWYGYGISFKKIITEGEIHCHIWFRSHEGGHEGGINWERIYIRVEAIPNNIPKTTVFNKEYRGAEYVADYIKKRNFWSGKTSNEYGGMKLVKHPSAEYQYLKIYLEKARSALCEKKKRTEEQEEQECKKIFFGK